MYQTVGHMGIEMYAEAMGLPLFREKTSGKTSQGGSKSYEPEKGDEVEDLYRLLSNIKVFTKLKSISTERIHIYFFMFKGSSGL